MVWSFLGGLFGSGASSAFGSAMNYAYSKALQNNQYKLNLKGLKESPAAQRTGLENAGYNPILAVNSSGMANATTGATAGLSDNGFGSSFANAYKTFKLEKDLNKAQISNLQADNLQKDANATLAKEQAQTEQYKRDNLSFQNAMLDIEKHLKEKDLAWYDRKAYADIYELMQRAENYRAMQSIESYNAQTARKTFQLNREMQEYEKDYVKRFKEFGSRHPNIRNTMETVGRFFNGFGASYSHSSK